MNKNTDPQAPQEVPGKSSGQVIISPPKLKLVIELIMPDHPHEDATVGLRFTVSGQQLAQTHRAGQFVDQTKETEVLCERVAEHASVIPIAVALNLFGETGKPLVFENDAVVQTLTMMMAAINHRVLREDLQWLLQFSTDFAKVSDELVALLAQHAPKRKQHPVREKKKKDHTSET